MTPLPTQGYAVSTWPGKPKPYASSVVGAASIGGGSVAPSILTPEDELASRRVRSLYDSGSDIQSSYYSDAGSMITGGRTKRLSRGLRNSLVATDEEDRLPSDIGSGMLRKEGKVQIQENNGHSEVRSVCRSVSVEIPAEKEEILPAGGMEDWRDLESKDVDRYVAASLSRTRILVIYCKHQLNFL